MHTYAVLYCELRLPHSPRRKDGQTSPTRRAVFFLLFLFLAANSKYGRSVQAVLRTRVCTTDPCTDDRDARQRLRVVFYNNKQAVLERGDCEIHRLSIVESLDYY